jgi:hypothetical protein
MVRQLTIVILEMCRTHKVCDLRGSLAIESSLLIQIELSTEGRSITSKHSN